MNIQTKYVGDVTVESDKIIHFKSGLPGFNDETEFVLLQLPGTPAEAFQTLQSIKTPDLAFVVANPYQFYQDYEFRLDHSIVEYLKIQDEKDVLILTIVTLKSPFENSTINLKAPLIINSTRKRGKQYILNEEDYPTKAALVSPHVSQAKGE
ncbi:MAG TPA: flagellar assembly protein FliW [Virgibacillus sp.]|nr:flagellar assembly protein FliW [Virgibacillus sp.]